MQVKTNLKAGGITTKHNQTQVGSRTKRLRVKTSLKAGGIQQNHNQTLVRPSGLKVR